MADDRERQKVAAGVKEKEVEFHLNLKDKRFFIMGVCSSFLLLVSMWQIEIIWVCLQNGWVYGLPFGFETHNYWLAHDFWFTLIFASWVLLAISIMLKK